MSDRLLLDSIKVGAVRYSVIEKTDLHSVDSDERKVFLHGQIVYDAAEIRVCHEQSQDVKVAAVLHESIHAILNQAGHQEHSEAMVVALGYGLLALLRDNPELVGLILVPH